MSIFANSDAATKNSPRERRLSSCPICEFGGQTTDSRPQADNRLNKCRACGAKWRDISSQQKPVNDQLLPDFSRQKFTYPLAAVLAATVILTTGWYIFPERNPKPVNTPKNLAISGVSIESFTNSNQPVWIITGKVNNNSPHALHIPPIKIFSLEKGSSGYFTWTYRSALQKLAPGASFRFRTAIRKPAGISSDIQLKFDAG